MAPLMGKKILQAFNATFPFWSSRVAKWRPSGLFGIVVSLTDGNRLYFSDNGKRQKLFQMNGKKKGRLIYDSDTDHRKGA